MWNRIRLLSCFFIMITNIGFAAEEVVDLPAPDTKGGKPLMAALEMRRTSRSFSSKKLPIQVLSNLLWAATGVNRPDSGKLTAPTAVNWQEIIVYVAKADGLFLYNPHKHVLELILAEDIREQVGMQPFTQKAPVGLIYVADFSRMGTATDEQKLFYSATDTGFVSQNVYLFCASAGLSTVVLGMVDKSVLARKMGLSKEQHIILTQPVGYPEE